MSCGASEIRGQRFAIIESENEEAIGKEASSICSSTIFLMSGILKIKTVDNSSSSRSMHHKFDGLTSVSNTSYLSSFSSISGSEKLSSQSFDRVQKLRSASNAPAADPSDWLFANIALGMVYVGSCSLKNALLGAHDLNMLLSSLSVGGEFEKITWGIQGGLLFLDTKALETFISCFTSYLHSITNILSGIQPFHKVIGKVEHNMDTTRLDDHYTEDYIQETIHIPSQAKGQHVQELSINVSQLSTVLVTQDEKGGIQELVLEIDVHLNLESGNMTKKFVFDLKRLSILSQVLQQSSGKEVQIPHFYSVTLNNISSRFESGDSTSELQHRDMVHPLNDPSCSRDYESEEELCTKNHLPEGFNISYQKHILKHLGAFLLVQKHVNDLAWVGSGSISGSDVIISVSAMEMILFITSSFSGVLSKTTASDFNKKQRPSSQEEFDNSVQEMVPNGSVVAIQDVHQHMYFAVDGEENKYTLGGTIHYSLVGERALFRVKYHQKKWISSTLWFSLISLHAKNDLGKPLRLNYCPGSGFVDISSTDDGGWASWRIVFRETESYDSDIDWEPYNKLVKKNFYLVNKKNDCAVAFVDGIPEFVRKPGNPFKFKVFDNLFIACDVGNTDSHPLEDSRTSEQDNTSLVEGRTSVQCGKLPCIDIMEELLHPVEIFLFYRSNFHIQGSEANFHGVPVHIHCRTKELNMSLSELSLDILLFVIGKLNLAGPYSLKSSRILVNRCKVENQTGVNLLCHFFNKQSMKIARKQSTSIVFRIFYDFPNFSLSLASSKTCLESTYHVISSIQSDGRILGIWMSIFHPYTDSRTYPGPFVVVDISRESEDGLSVIVSPLIRIHNETKFSMELQFRRPHQKEDEFASLVLKPGDTIDDSMAMFGALHLSGGMKKALTSLSLGNFLLSFRPDTTEGLMNSKSALSAEWSHDLKGGKAVRLSGIFDKLGYKVRKALLNESVKCSFSTAQCSFKSEGSHIDDIHFLIQSIARDVPIVQPNDSKEGFEYSTSPVTLQEQKEIFILPTVKVSNLLQSEIHVILSEMDACSKVGWDNTGNQAIISCGSSVDFYVNPSVIYFTVTLTPYNSSCKPLKSSDWEKKLQRQKSEVHHLDIDLEFGNKDYFASLRLSRGLKGILEATVFTSYALKNDTDFSLYFFAPNRKPLTRHELEELGYSIPPELGALLPPMSTRSWFLKSNKVCLKLLEDSASEASIDLDALSGLTELSLEIEESIGVKSITKLGVSMGPPLSTIVVPSQLVTMVPRYVVANESEGTISIRQYYLQDDTAGNIIVNSKQKITLQLWNAMSKRREFSFFETLIRKHGKANDDALVYIQFRPNEPELSWSGPVCIASLGRFFIKFRKQQSGEVASPEEFAAVHIVEEGSTLVLHYHRPPNINLPYRIENCLHDVSITYYQKDSSEEPEVLGSESSADYVWDDLTLPHKLVVRINGNIPQYR
ncbi:hypothetical protein L484_020299 [Morus notabilis]|uniref:Vacuolar protein sorting-associated protein 13 VPS13 adaptor binding domain-containing protein n=1 Tax=Morus notabilis TaxID=981085 RepID=W9QRZ6_9ROSA|nr:hypothetical protein L484_020299 [Morus notabilis]